MPAHGARADPFFARAMQFDTFAKDKIIVPINLGNQHWVCAAINIKEKRFEYYDSLGNANNKVYAVR